jgi:hypothetical protein
MSGAQGRVERNVIHGCELPGATGAPDPQCLAATNLDAGNTGLAVDYDLGTVIANNYVFSRETACRLGDKVDPTGSPSYPLSVTFANNACIAYGPAWRDDYPVTALVLGGAFSGAPVIASNILDAAGGGSSQAFAHDSSYQNSTPRETYSFLANDLVPHGQTCTANVYLPGQLCYAAASDLNARSNAVQVITSNIGVDPAYAGPLAGPGAGDAAGPFHLSAGCALGGLGTPAAGVSTDFDGRARDPATPTIGPSECQR